MPSNTGSARTGRAPASGSSYTWDHIKEVQSLIERCMQHYMTQTEIIATLQVQAEIEPALTCLVWQKLEEQNPDFFLSYSACLRLKDQIVAFNYLVEQQTRLLQKLTHSLPPGVQLNSNAATGQWTEADAADAQQQQLAQQMQQQQQLQMARMPAARFGEKSPPGQVPAQGAPAGWENQRV